MKKLTKFLSLIFIIMLTQSCSKDTKCSFADTNIYYNVADSNKAKIPYTGSDTLVFISDQGDTATLVGQGKKTNYNTTKTNLNNVDCPKIENNFYEKIEYSFYGLDTKFNTLQLLINSADKYSSENLIRIFVNGNQYSDFSTLQYLNSNISPDDSIFQSTGYQSGITMNNKIILFNLKLGVLKIKDFLNGKIWILSNKK